MRNVYLTGDTHANVNRLLNIPDDEMTKDDIVIVLGDFGVIWSNEEQSTFVLEQLGKKNFTTAFLDGNHENFNLIKQMEKIDLWNGGFVGILPGNVIHLLRGEIYNLNGKNVGVCGGADSIDKFRRVEGISWWADESITDEDVKRFRANLERKNIFKLDIMLSHDCPISLLPRIRMYSGVNGSIRFTQSQKALEQIYSMVNIDKWYFGHWHTDNRITDQFRCLYYDIIQIM